MAEPRRNTVIATTVPLLVAPPSNNRVRLIVNNVGPSVIYCATNSDRDVDTAFPIGVGQVIETDDPYPQYVFTTASTSSVGIWDDCG